MRGWRISSFFGPMRLVPRWSVAPEELPLVVERMLAAGAVRAAATTQANFGVLEAIHRTLHLSNTIGFAPGSDALSRDVLAAVLSGALVAVREVETTPVHVYRPEPEVWEPPPPPAPVKVTASLEVKFVYDQIDKGVAGLEFRVRTPDGKEQQLKTDGSGLLRLRNIDPGYVDLWTEVDGAALETTVTARAEGDRPTTGFSEDYETEKPARRLLRVDALRVHKGDTFKALAEECDMKWKTLALFNFGTDDEKKVNEALQDYVGCRYAESLDEMEFTDFDSPGLLYIPKPWKATFHTSQTPIVRLAGVDQPKQGFLFST